MNIFNQLTPFQYFKTRSKLESVQESMTSDMDTESLVTDSNGAQKRDICDNVIVQGIVLEDENADNIIAEVASLAEMVRGISIKDCDSESNNTEASSLVKLTSRTFEEKESETTSLITDEIDTAEFEGDEWELVDEEFSSLLAKKGVDLDKFIMGLSSVSEEDEYQDFGEASSNISFDQNGADETNTMSTALAHSPSLETEEKEGVIECNGTIHPQDCIERDTHSTGRSIMKSTIPNYIKSLLKEINKFENSIVELIEHGIQRQCPKLDTTRLCTMRKRNTNIRLASVLIVKGTKSVLVLCILHNVLNTESVPRPLKEIGPVLVVLSMLMSLQRNYSVNVESIPSRRQIVLGDCK